MVAHGPRKKSLDFDGNPDHVTLVLRQQLLGAPPYSAWEAVLPGISLTLTILRDYMTGRGTVNIVIKTAWGCIVLAYSVIAWGILCTRREGSGVAVQATAMRRHL